MRRPRHREADTRCRIRGVRLVDGVQHGAEFVAGGSRGRQRLPDHTQLPPAERPKIDVNALGGVSGPTTDNPARPPGGRRP